MPMSPCLCEWNAESCRRHDAPHQTGHSEQRQHIGQHEQCAGRNGEANGRQQELQRRRAVVKFSINSLNFVFLTLRPGASSHALSNSLCRSLWN